MVPFKARRNSLLGGGALGAVRSILRLQVAGAAGWAAWRHWSWLWVAVVIVTAVPPRVAAQEIGSAQKVVKDVWGGGLAWRVQPQRKVRFREQINVSPQSAVEFRLNDSTTLSIGENSEIWLDEFVYDPALNVVEGTIKFSKGAMRFVGSAAKKNLIVEVPVGVIGIRGTAFNLRVDRAQFELEVLSGAVEV